MTRLSDLLRSAADRAPVGEASVAVGRAARRVRVQRGVRGAANGVAGLGVVALITLGIVQPGSAINHATAALVPVAAPAAGAAAPKDSSVASDARSMAWGTCGSFPLQNYGTGGTDAFSIAAKFDAAGTYAGGDTVKVPVTVTANGAVDVTTAGPDVVVLWQGMVVAAMSRSDAQQALKLAAGNSADFSASLPFVDCFASKPLPASDYELVVSQAFTNAAAATNPAPAPAPAPTPAPTPAPAPAPTPAPTPEPPLGPAPQTTFPVNPGAGTGNASTSDVAVMPVEPPAWDYRITADPIGFTIAGNPVDNPFADYYPQASTPPAQPDDILTPAKARELYDAAATTLPWDMAKGSSRWVIAGGYAGKETFAPVAPTDTSYGCSWDGVTSLHFPKESADLNLLAITGSVPSRVAVSYGWVVDNNPKATLSVTNKSTYSIPGFFGQPSSALYLVKDGRVVAQAYPVGLDPNAGMLMKQSAVAPTANSTEDPATYWGTLAPAASLSGTYLWRDINACSRQDGTVTSVASGTYTLLTMQSVSLQPSAGIGGPTGIIAPGSAARANPATTIGSPVAGGASGGASTGASGGAPASSTPPIVVDPVPVPGPVPGPGQPDQQDWLEFQVWASLGTVTITTH
jgi:hypothetical protein